MPFPLDPTVFRRQFCVDPDEGLARVRAYIAAVSPLYGIDPSRIQLDRNMTQLELLVELDCDTIRRRVFDINVLRVYQNDVLMLIWSTVLELLTERPNTLSAPIAFPGNPLTTMLFPTEARHRVTRKNSAALYRMLEARYPDIAPILDLQETLTVSVQGVGTSFIYEFTGWDEAHLPAVRKFAGWDRLLHSDGEFLLIIQDVVPTQE